MTSPSRLDPSLAPTETGPAGAFEFDPGLRHLNHGSYGAVPRTVRLAQDRWRAAIERDPTGFFQYELPPALRSMAAHVARRLGGRSDDWVFCENATAAANAVLHSLDLKPGDAILTTSHVYGAVQKAMALVAARRQAELTIAALSPILESGAEVVAAIEKALTPRTRLLIVDHITSSTAAILPVREIVALARLRQVPVLVDGAHAPGQMALDVPSIGADWYTGNAHKWLFAPRGCAVLWTASASQEFTRPAVLSHGADRGYAAAFDWIGTRDPSPWLCFENAALAHDAFGGDALIARNTELAASAAAHIAGEIGATPSAPEKMRAAMASLALQSCRATDAAAAAFRLALADEHRLVAPIFVFADRLWVRLSAQIYNSPADYDCLAEALKALLPRFQ